MLNTNCLEGFECPKCGHTDTFYIRVTSSFEALMSDAGIIDGGGDTEWSENSDCRCGDCGFESTVQEFKK